MKSIIVFLACLLLALWLPTVADAAPHCNVTQYFRRPVCQDGRCRMVNIPREGDGIIVGRADDGNVIVLAHAEGRARGIVFVDVCEEGTRPVAGRLLALDRTHDLALIAIPHPEPIEANTNVSKTIKEFVRHTLGKLPVADKPHSAPPPAETAPAAPAPPPLSPLADKPAAAAANQGSPAIASSNAPANVTPPPAIDVEDLRRIMRDEIAKPLAEHRSQIEATIVAQAQAGRIDPKAFVPIVETAARTGAKHIAAEVIAQGTPAMLAALAKAGASGALAGTPLGIPGMVATAALSVAGFLFHRSLKNQNSLSVQILEHLRGAKRDRDNPPQRGPTAALPSEPSAPSCGDYQTSAPAPALPPPAKLDTTNTVTRDESWRTAYSRAKQEYRKKYPNDADSLVGFESFFNQFLGGLQHAPLEK